VPAHPFTHHEILGLIEPFTRRGRHPDLAASNRLERRLAFKPLEHLAPGTACPVLRETLVLEHRDHAEYRLTRELTLPCGLAASLEADSADPATLLADLPRTRTPWEQVLRTQLARGLARRPDLSWSRPTRSYLANQGRAGAHHRMPWEPGVTPSKSVPRLVVIVDVSGSIEDRLLERFAREIQAITRRLEAGLVLVIGDDQVQRVVQCEPGGSDLGAIEFKGRGGTDFTPLLEEADWHHPDIGVVLTDLQGSARFRPRWPVLWAVPEAFARAVQPFGRKLSLC
jgi:hypothetical protein